jgi:hypothetical protein
MTTSIDKWVWLDDISGLLFVEAHRPSIKTYKAPTNIHAPGERGPTNRGKWIKMDMLAHEESRILREQRAQEQLSRDLAAQQHTRITGTAVCMSPYPLICR